VKEGRGIFGKTKLPRETRVNLKVDGRIGGDEAGAKLENHKNKWSEV